MTEDRLRDAILDELIALDRLPPRQPGDFTLQEYAERAELTEATARYRLKGKVQQGLLETAEVQGADRRKVRIWRRPRRSEGGQEHEQ